MSPERAVHRVTGELAQWFGLDAGRLAPGARADLVVVDPEALDDRLDALHEQPVAPPAAAGPFSELRRLVRRNDAAVRRVLVAGRTAWHDGALAPELGRERFGTVLRPGA
ncbi:amidohydrolase family protein [Nannocystis pusilla]|uniref:Amidohydrolase family protein n=1 Tax=Nannocystis pusilla TaxID=889268 RepID=A0A9X3ET20_9BACT|nr:amidohydrolase family protein [Nannocystis pusilla]MCY1009784.1 amidohydrolase family protein [Nannocystis pusilla]